MGLFIYNISIRLYGLLIRLVSLFNQKARLFVQGRKGLFKKLEETFAGNERPVLWLHAASLGEFEQGRPVLEAFRQAYPHYRILLTFYSPSGYEVRKNYAGADDVFYLPEDSKANAGRFLTLVNPSIAILVKYEFWYHLIRESVSRGVQTIGVSTIIRSNHLLLKPQGRFLADCAAKMHHFFVQDEQSRINMQQINIDQVTVAGDTRYDRVWDIAAKAQEIPIAEHFAGDQPTMVIGSSWPSDMEVLYPVIKTFSDRFKFIIAPHNLKETELSAIEKNIEGRVIRYSKAATDERLATANVLLIDNIGMLSSLYRYGRYAYVGGALRGTLHNTLEAAVYGIPVFFGKHANNQKFVEATDLVRVGGGQEITSADQLITAIKQLESDAELRDRTGNQSGELVQQSRGGTEKVMDYLGKIISA